MTAAHQWTVREESRLASGRELSRPAQPPPPPPGPEGADREAPVERPALHGPQRARGASETEWSARQTGPLPDEPTGGRSSKWTVCAPGRAGEVCFDGAAAVGGAALLSVPNEAADGDRVREPDEPRCVSNKEIERERDPLEAEWLSMQRLAHGHTRHVATGGLKRRPVSFSAWCVVVSHWNRI